LREHTSSVASHSETQSTAGPTCACGASATTDWSRARLLPTCLPQQDEFVNLTVRDQLRLVRSFYSHWGGVLVSRPCAHWTVDPAMRMKSMSVGERQKLSILLASRPRSDLLILDEPGLTGREGQIDASPSSCRASAGLSCSRFGQTVRAPGRESHTLSLPQSWRPRTLRHVADVPDNSRPANVDGP
jgi:hypothetical protein